MIVADTHIHACSLLIQKFLEEKKLCRLGSVMTIPNWQKHEKDIQERFGLSPTVCSGNKWSDPSDGVDNTHYSENVFQSMVDCKVTSKKSYRLSRLLLSEWREKARTFGKVFWLPLRFEYEDGETQDWIVIHKDDFGELYDLAREPKVVVEQALTFRTEKIEDDLDYLYRMSRKIKTPDVKLRLLEIIEDISQELPEAPE